MNVWSRWKCLDCDTNSVFMSDICWKDTILGVFCANFVRVALRRVGVGSSIHYAKDISEH